MPSTKRPSRRTLTLTPAAADEAVRAFQQRYPPPRNGSGHTSSERALVAANTVSTVLRNLTRLIDGITAHTGWNRSQVFDDMLVVLEATLRDLPYHTQAAMRGDTPCDWPPQLPEHAKEDWHQVQHRYTSERTFDGQPAQLWVLTQFAQALRVLVQAAEHGFYDWLGSLFMQLGLGNAKAGQYYTPWPLALMLSQMIDPSQLVYDRIKQALLHPDNGYGRASLLASLLMCPHNETAPDDGSDDTPERFFREQLLPAAAPFYEPVTILDPAVGSGVMLLATAASVEPWMNSGGFIQYMGMDIDPRAVRMCRIQLMLYGLNGYQSECELAIHGTSFNELRGSDPEMEAVIAQRQADAEARRAAKEDARADAAAQAEAESLLGGKPTVKGRRVGPGKTSQLPTIPRPITTARGNIVVEQARLDDLLF